jgi:hypothetical protein
MLAPRKRILSFPKLKVQVHDGDGSEAVNGVSMVLVKTKKAARVMGKPVEGMAGYITIIR